MCTAGWVGVPLGWRTASLEWAIVGGVARYVMLSEQRCGVDEREDRLFVERLGCGVTFFGKHWKHVPASRLNVESPSAIGGANLARYRAWDDTFRLPHSLLEQPAVTQVSAKQLACTGSQRSCPTRGQPNLRAWPCRTLAWPHRY